MHVRTGVLNFEMLCTCVTVHMHIHRKDIPIVHRMFKEALLQYVGIHIDVFDIPSTQYLNHINFSLKRIHQ